MDDFERSGRSDFPGQVNNVLAFPGLVRGALAARANCCTDGMKQAAVDAIVASVDGPRPKRSLPAAFGRSGTMNVGRAVKAAAEADGVCLACGDA
jgi:malate dehydrogenase (oxaloacetate-decarboxylating)